MNLNDETKQDSKENYTNDEFVKMALEKLAREHTVEEFLKLREEFLKENPEQQELENKRTK